MMLNRMNCFPLSEDIFIFTDYKSICVCNHLFQTLQEKQINNENIVFNEKYQQIYTCQFANGKIYVADNQYIHEFVFDDLKYIYGDKYKTCVIKAINNQIIYSNNQLYQKNYQSLTKNFTIPKSILLGDGYLKSWIDICLKVRPHQYVSVIQKDFTEKLICKIDEQFAGSTFFQGGIMIMQAQNNFVVVDAINEVAYKCNEKQIADSNIMQLLELQYCGLTLSNHVLSKIMKRQGCGMFLKAREEHYEKWMVEFQNQEGFDTQAYQKLLNSVKQYSDQIKNNHFNKEIQQKTFMRKYQYRMIKLMLTHKNESLLNLIQGLVMENKKKQRKKDSIIYERETIFSKIQMM